MTEQETLPPVSEEELDADRPGELLSLLVTETQAAPSGEPDWKSIDEKLFARIEQEQAAHAKAQRGGKVLWVAFAGTLAAAAAALLFMKSGPVAPVAMDDAAHAGSFLSSRGATVQVGGAVAHEGQSFAAGDRLDARDGSPLFQQEGHVVFDLEHDSTVSVQHAASPLVLSLERGATEAQVTPVPNGEAFAVDIVAQGGAVARVAVHGTHLRVARAGDHVVVDLTEGVVSVGTPARRGSTYGTLVTAPAHVEFDIADIEHSLVVEHGSNAVRAADALAPEVKTAALPKHDDPAPLPGVRHDDPPHADHVPNNVAAAAAAVVTAPKPSIVDPAPTTVLEPNENADQDLAAAVRACVSALPHAPEVTVTISSTLTLKVGADGFVQAARFDPPLPVDAQECAARSIYRKTRFVHGGDVSVPIVITR